VKKIVLAALLLSVIPGRIEAQEEDVRQLMTRFVAALQDADWPAFRACWVEHPVMYSPTEMTRFDDGSFDAEWQRAFQQIRQTAATRGITTAPYVKVDPQEMRIDFPSPTVAVITFHLTDNNRPRRRMFVAARTDAGWKLANLDSSDLSGR
jgi:hypothetical protein